MKNLASVDKEIIVISGVNLVSGGPISVYYDFLSILIKCGYSEQYRIIALVGDRELFSRYADDIELIEYKKPRSSWLFRIYYEYVFFNKLSKKINVKIWISLHDTTPNVKADKRYVYCHNPSPFNNMKLREAKYGIKYYLFSKFYKYLYAINIKRNDGVIVQQDWMRKEFIKMYHINNVIVARPSMPDIQKIEDKRNSEDKIFVFPSFPRYFKNFEVACEAVKILNNENIGNFKLYITLDGTENKYSQYLRKKYADIPNIIFIGLLKREQLFDLYARSSALIFMSRLETWGMPIMEYKKTLKPMIVSDLPYAHETVGDYHNVSFISVNDVVSIADKMRVIINGDGRLGKASSHKIEQPFAKNWEELCSMLM